MLWIGYAATIVLAYLVGAIPTGYVLVMLFKRVDIRKVGSGRTGGTNVLRTAGPLPAALTVLGDFAKGYGAVALAWWLVPGSDLAAALAGVAAVAGHNWSVYLGFDGGAGTMTTVGAALALTPLAALIAGGAAIAVIAIWRYASLGSLTLAAVLTLAYLDGVLWGGYPITHMILALGTTVMTAWQLRPNIKRLLQGTERKVGQAAPNGQVNSVPVQSVTSPLKPPKNHAK